MISRVGIKESYSFHISHIKSFNKSLKVKLETLHKNHSIMSSKSLLLATIAAIFLFQEALGYLHCSKWQQGCQKYRSKCTDSIKRTCCDHLKQDSNDSEIQSGVYTVTSGSFSTSEVWCDMKTNQGGWTVITRRESNKTSFDRLYSEYEEGFGDLNGDFWYGLRAMEALTSQESYEMQLDMYMDANSTNASASAHYDNFKVEGSHYNLTLGNFTGSDSELEDRLRPFHNKGFVAKKTVLDTMTCTDRVSAGWWFAKYCLSGENEPQGTALTRLYKEINWYDTKMRNNVREFAKYEMKIRRKSCISGITT